MRIKLECRLKRDSLPMGFRRLLMSFIKAAVESYNGEKFDELFNKNQCRSKSYSFAVAFPQGTKFEGGKIHLSENAFTITFSTGIYADLVLFYNAFLSKRGQAFSLPEGNHMRVERISYVNVPPILKDCVEIKMLSPLVLRLHNRQNNKDRYVSHDDKDFQSVFLETTKRQFDNLGVHADLRGLCIEAKQARSVVIQEFGIQYLGNLGIFVLQGNPEVLNVLQAAGLGSRRNTGNGLFKVIQ